MKTLDLQAVRQEYPPDKDGHIYFNSGCCGRKPQSVLDAMARADEKINTNPCHFTFLDNSPVDQARETVSQLLSVPKENILLACSTTNALQILMQSFLLRPGDELVTTDQEHGSLRTIAQYLSETRGIVVRRHAIDLARTAEVGASEHLCQGLLSLVNEKTKLVALSKIVSYTGWCPDLSVLARGLEARGVPLIADCAHGPGQMLCQPEGYPMWVASGHKWLGAPNGTAFAYVRSDLAERLIPVSLSDTYYAKKDANPCDLARLEGTGTSDQSRWRGLTRAIDLHLSLGSEAVVHYQLELAKYLRHKLEAGLSPQFRTEDLFDKEPQQCTSMLNFRFEPERLKVPNLQDYLWEEHKIAVQLDFLNIVPGNGMRVSCHISNSRDDIDCLLAALENVVIK